MWFSGEGFGAYVIYALTSQGGSMMDYVSFDHLGDYMGMFLTKPDVIRPMGLNGEIGMMSNDGKLYSTSLLSPFFTGPAIESNKGYEVDAVFLLLQLTTMYMIRRTGVLCRCLLPVCI